MRAAVVRVTLRIPVLAHLGPYVLRRVPFDLVDRQRVAAHFAVIAHAKLRLHGGKARPFTPLAEQQQPVVAQPIFLVSAGPALQKGVDFARLCVFQPRTQFPVRGPGLQDMAARLWQELRQTHAVLLAKCLLHIDQHLVRRGGRRTHGQRLRAAPHGHQGQRKRQGCQNLRPMHGGNYVMDKAALRRALVEQRLNMPARLERADLLQRVMRIWLVDRPDTVIGAYWPIKGEFDPLPALHRWKEDGELLDEPQLRRIGLPVVNKQHKTLTFHAWYPGCEMEEDAYGIPKPKDTEVIVPTLLFVPCVGYAAGGYRLGYGGGFYDRTLATLQPRPVTVGLGYTQGFLDDFVPEPHDLPLDAILNDNGIVWPV